MSYIDVLREAEDMVTPGMSACQGCGGELILRTVLQVSGKNTIIGIPPGCMAGAGVVGWNYSNGLKIPVHIPLLDNTASFLTGLSQMYERKGRTDVNIVAVAGDGQPQTAASRVFPLLLREMKRCCMCAMTMKDI